MHVDSDDLLARIKADHPQVYELCLYKVLVAQLEQDNARLRAELDTRDQATPPGYQPLNLGGEHG